MLKRLTNDVFKDLPLPFKQSNPAMFDIYIVSPDTYIDRGEEITLLGMLPHQQQELRDAFRKLTQEQFAGAVSRFIGLAKELSFEMTYCSLSGKTCKDRASKCLARAAPTSAN